MPEFLLSAHAAAAVEEVWKLLHDPGRFPEWWEGVGAIETGEGAEFTMWPAGYPDFPMAQRLQAHPGDGRVTISCLVSNIEYVWQLREAGEGTEVEVHARLPEVEAHRLNDQRSNLSASLARLAAMAAAA